MAENESGSDKTEEPTQKRLEEAEKKGQIAFSREINNFFMMLALALSLVWLVPYMLQETRVSFAPYITAPHDMPVDMTSIREMFMHSAIDMARILMPFMLIIIVLVVGGAAAQSKLIFSADRITPKWEKISPMKGLKRLFSLRSLLEFLKGILKMILVGVVCYIVVNPELDRFADLATYSTMDMLSFVSEIAIRIAIGVTCIMFLFGILDFLYQRYDYIKNLKMTKQEVKEEYKQQEGDPIIKQRLRQIRMEKARTRMMASVPKADVVITNPTHFAVALSYETGLMQAPKVVAKGVDKVAFRIREVAEEHDVPIVENPPLARALFASVELDQEIPMEHYKAVAEVIGYVYRLRGKL